MKIPTSASKSDFKLVSTQTVYHTGIYFKSIDTLIIISIVSSIVACLRDPIYSKLPKKEGLD